jgi:hypothetical protein
MENYIIILYSLLKLKIILCVIKIISEILVIGDNDNFFLEINFRLLTT